jgi:hypothetical protein
MLLVEGEQLLMTALVWSMQRFWPCGKSRGVGTTVGKDRNGDALCMVLCRSCACSATHALVRAC